MPAPYDVQVQRGPAASSLHVSPPLRPQTPPCMHRIAIFGSNSPFIHTNHRRVDSCPPPTSIHSAGGPLLSPSRAAVPCLLSVEADAAMVRPPTSLLAVALLCCMSVHGAPAMAPAINVSDSNLTDAIATDAYAANATFNATANASSIDPSCDELPAWGARARVAPSLYTSQSRFDLALGCTLDLGRAGERLNFRRSHGSVQRTTLYESGRVVSGTSY